jgi:regulator of protease activity HflC (stomatin/prohibitin superfamily)
MSFPVELVLWGIFGLSGVFYLLSSIQIVRPTEVRLVERFGKYVKTLGEGLHFIIPGADTVHPVNITETMMEIAPQIIITKDKLNVEVDAVIYHRVVDAQKATYAVHDYESQVDMLASTLLRSGISKMTMAEANENRDKINEDLKKIMDEETAHYGVDVMRVEIQAIKPPEDVVHAMNEVLKAEQGKLAAAEKAKAAEQVADGERMAAIKRAEGQAKAVVLAAAKSVQMINKAMSENFDERAQRYKELETAASAFENNTKFMVPQGSNLLNLITDSFRGDKK